MSKNLGIYSQFNSFILWRVLSQFLFVFRELFISTKNFKERENKYRSINNWFKTSRIKYLKKYKVIVLKI